MDIAAGLENNKNLQTTNLNQNNKNKKKDKQDAKELEQLLKQVTSFSLSLALV